MARIFISAGHGGFENGVRDPGIVAGGTTEAQEMIRIRDILLSELRSRGVQALAVPDDLSQVQTIDWINTYSHPGDVAIELHTGGSPNPSNRGVTVFYIAYNSQRKKDAELILWSLLRRVPQFPSRGAKPDTETGLGHLIFCRWIVIPSLYIEIGYLTNPNDRNILQSRRADIATGLADGLVAWVKSEHINPTPPLPPGNRVYGSIGIRINGQVYGERGLLVNGNSYIPIDLVDRLGIDLTQLARVIRIRYNNIVYVKAIDLRNFGIAVSWDNPNRTVVLRSISRLYNDQIDRIMGGGYTTEVQMIVFLKSENPDAPNQFPEIAKLYRREAMVEGVNYDVAFCQMCLETDFLKFGGIVKPSDYNFAGLGTVGGSSEIAVFATAEEGVRAHIQHLKAYATHEPIVQEIVDPRFDYITRGVAPSVFSLGGRWSDDLQYGDRIVALVRRLYEMSGLL